MANSVALQMAGITATSADPMSGTVVRLGDRTPSGVLIEGGAPDPVRRLLPPVSQAQQADLLARQCRLYNRRIGVVRDPGRGHGLPGRGGVGCHAVGDCAVRRVLDAYQQVALWMSACL